MMLQISFHVAIKLFIYYIKCKTGIRLILSISITWFKISARPTPSVRKVTRLETEKEKEERKTPLIMASTYVLPARSMDSTQNGNLPGKV